MSPLLDFPTEILQQILEDVVHSDLESVTLCCKRLYVLGIKALLEHREQKGKYTKIICSPTKRSQGENVFDPTLLLRDVLNDHNMASYPEILHITGFGSGSEYDARSSDSKQVLHDLHDKLIAMIGPIPYEYYPRGCVERNKESWFRSVLEGDLPSTVALLLCLLPELRLFSIGHTRMFSNGLGDIVSQIGLSSLKGYKNHRVLSQLTEVTLNSCGITNMTECLFAFAGLPSLRSLHGISFHANCSSSSHLENASAITSLKLEKCTGHLSAVTSLIKECTGLKQFQLSFKTCAPTRLQLAPYIIIQSLKEHTKSTLESLDLTGHDRKSCNQGRGIYIGSLQDFTRLERIRVDNDMFKIRWTKDWRANAGMSLGYQQIVGLLPHSATCLSLALPVEKGGASRMLRGLAVHRSCLPKLTDIIFEDSNDLDGETEEACNGVGISIRQEFYSDVVKGFEALKLG